MAAGVAQAGTFKVAELFAGVGGFRVGFDHANEDLGYEAFETIWANQWEPPGTESKQFAWRCYEAHFGEGSCINEDINKVLEQAEAGERSIPDFDLLVGGFPCQDYSVARPLSQAEGIEGKKGVLWWDIYHMLEFKRGHNEGRLPRYVLLENVDRLLKSPASQRGRDFAVILSCLYSLGYSVEWRVINAGEFGMPQRRRRTYIYAELDAPEWNLGTVVLREGVLAKSFPMDFGELDFLSVGPSAYETSNSFGVGLKTSPFLTAGAMQKGSIVTGKGVPFYRGPQMTLGDVLVPESEVPESFFIEPDKLGAWEYLKGAKREERTAKSGYTYFYSEGAMTFPDALDKPSRTILTGEGGKGASRFKHVVECADGRYRRLVPDELDSLQCFPRGWTATGMSDHQRAFCMGNALVTDIPRRIGVELAKRMSPLARRKKVLEGIQTLPPLSVPDGFPTPEQMVREDRDKR